MNWEIIGHEWAVQLLKGHLINDQLRHAYLFTGPDGIGKRTIAVRFAQAINCPQTENPGQPCLNCRSCRQIDKFNHPDIRIVESVEQEDSLKVEQIRELQVQLALAPYQARYKIALLLRFEEATNQAQNALLKTLEEPPSQVILLLTAESAENLLPTITSRCEILRLRPLPLEFVRKGLQEKWGVSAEEAEILAHLSSGRPGYALSLYQQPEALKQRQKWISEQWGLLIADRVRRFAYAEKLAKDKVKLQEAIQSWSSFWRDVLLRASKADVPLSNLQFTPEIEQLAEGISPHTAGKVLRELDNTLQLIDRNVNLRLAAEVLVLNLPSIK